MCWIRNIFIIIALEFAIGCQFYPPGEYLRFVRVPENLKIGEEILKIQVHPRNNLSLQPVDRAEDVHYFTYRDYNRTTVSLLLAKSLDELVDTDSPRNVLKFKVACDYDDGEDVITSSLSVTVYVEDINDHAPIFVGAPYYVTVDELTPVGMTVYRGIRATDRDKPNTPNSDVQYAIVAGNERGKFALDNTQQALITLKKLLDYDLGDREFLLTITASDRGLPPKSSNATVRIRVNDNDDLSPKFTKGVYRTKINEFYPITGERIHKLLHFEPAIYAFDQDLAIDAPIRYDIIAGNERHLFSLDHVNGSLFLEREIDLDAERSLPANTFVLQIQAAQLDDPLKTGVARVEVEMVDLNDNLPEFEVDFYNISIVENLPNGFSVLQIIATDLDQGDNAEFSYQLDDKSGAFTLDSRSGWLTVRDQSVLDREKRTTVAMRVYAKEKAPSVVTDKIGASSVNVEVTLLDANDNNPTFIPNNLYDFMIISDAQMGDHVGTIHAIDPDLGRNGLVSYTIQSAPNNTVPFHIDPKTGLLSVGIAPVPVGRHLLFIEAHDQPLNPSERRSSLAVVSIEVQPKNNKGNTHKSVPDFIGAPYEFWVGANVGIGTSVGQIRVNEPAYKKKLIYDLLHSYHEGVPFAVEERSGTITVVDDLSRFNRQNYDFEALVTNEQDVSLITNVTIHIVDPKDEKTILMKTSAAPIEFHIKENLNRTLIGKLGFKNANSSSLKFSIANQKDVAEFISITSDGQIYTEQPLDREKRDNYHLTVLAEYSKGSISGTGIYQVSIIVDDDNDNSPLFEREQYEGKIIENCKSGTEVDLNYLIHVSDNDVDENGQYSVTIFGKGSEKFRLDLSTGKIFFISADKPLDREETDLFILRLVAKDMGGLVSEAKLTIHVEDENDNPPIFMKFLLYPRNETEVLDYDSAGNRISHFEKESADTYVLTQTYLRAKRPKSKKSPIVSVQEDLNVGSPIIKLTALDNDFGENAVVKYEMVSETYIPNEFSAEPFHINQYFVVNPTNGEISISRTLPPESEFRLNISAADNGGLKDYISVRLLVKDINDHPPVFKKSWYNFDAEEGFYSKKILGVIEAIDSDFGANANISYKLRTNMSQLPFAITPYGGVLSIDGLLDRETKDKYAFVVIARDNPAGTRALSSTVNIEVNVLDVNDNAPMFYGYDDVIINNEPNTFHTDYQDRIPIYYATASENSPIGTPITKVFANDSDFTGNGNGLLLFDIPYKKNKRNLFTIDSKEGVITTIGKLDYETENTHNITLVASDLGSPSLSTTAMVVVTIIDVPEDVSNLDRPVFAHRYYEVEVEENVPVPLKLLTLNVTDAYRARKLRYSIINENDFDIKRTFHVDPNNGSLFIIQSPDRETRALYEVIIRLDQYKVGRDMTVMIYPVTSDKLGNLGLNEVKVIVRVTDVNDNAPKFTITGRPIIAAVPSNANYGYHVIRLQATDADLGLNGEVRYQILGRADETARRFAIDPITGQIRVIASFVRDAGKVYGFDVKATDRKGADDGRSSIANIFVYVLDDQKQLVMVMGMRPTDVENNMNNITKILYNATGYDIRIRKLEPHTERNQIDNSATDMYLYAVDPLLNVIVNMDHLQKLLQVKQNEIERKLEGPKVLAIASGVQERAPSRAQRVALSSLEVGVVVLGCIVFFGALATALCVICIRRKKRRLLASAFSQPLSYTIATNTISKPTLYPSSYGETLRYANENDFIQTSPAYRHESNCPRTASQRLPFRERSRSSGGLEKSITSVHSSGRDSGIVDTTVHCQCGHSSSQSSEDSNYEDSLQSVPRRKSRRSSTVRQISLPLAMDVQLRRSINEDINRTSGLQRIRSMSHIPNTSAVLVPGSAPFRRSSDRIVMGGS